MAQTSDEPAPHNPVRPGPSTAREALIAEAIGEASRMLQRLEAMEQRIQTLSDQLQVRTESFEAQTRRYAQAIAALDKAAREGIKRSLGDELRASAAPEATRPHAQPSDSTGPCTPMAASEAGTPSLQPLQAAPPLWMRHPVLSGLSALCLLTLAGAWFSWP